MTEITESSKLNDADIKQLCDISNKARKNILRMIHSAKSGHPGGSFSCIDILTTLYFKVLKHYKDWDKDPNWQNRDRFVLSKGHASPALYAILAEAGYFDKEELKTFRSFRSRLQGHPSFGCLPGVEVSTGSLGQGLSMACGIAIGLKLDKKDSRVYALMGDGENQEGQVWEAAMSAAHYKLGNLTAIVDRNYLQIDGNTESIMSLDPLAKKWQAFGWEVLEINGHDFQDIYCALQKSAKLGKETSKPVMIIANTTKGKGISFMEHQAGWHGKAPNCEELKTALNELDNLR